jgi:hypothetical protein
MARRYDGIGQLQATLAQRPLAHAMVMWTPSLLWHEVLHFCRDYVRLIVAPPIAYRRFPQAQSCRRLLSSRALIVYAGRFGRARRRALRIL